MSAIESSYKKSGYFYIKISDPSQRRFFASNDERAFVISQLQDLLSMRSILEDAQPHKRLASHIDLLAFSLKTSGIRLVVYAISKNSARILAEIINSRLVQFRDENTNGPRLTKSFPIVSVRSLRGPHHALAKTIKLHKLHHDWEYDRYSSIGFYIHERRGDWMRIWRLSNLYTNIPEVYIELLTAQPLDYNINLATKGSRSIAP